MAYQILVVDDEKLIVKGIKFSLEQDGMEVTAAYDGEEALQNIKEKNFDLVVLDVMLPDGDGFALYRQIRNVSDMPVIFLTARDEASDKLAGLGLGAEGENQSHSAPQCEKSTCRDTGEKSPEGKRPRAFLRQQARIYQRKGGKPDREGIRPSGAAHGKPRKGLQQRKASGYRLGL